MRQKSINYNLNHLDLLPLPSDVKLERMLLGLMLDVPTLYESLYKYLSMDGIFYDSQNSKVWEGIKKVVSFKMIPKKENVEGYFTRLGDRDAAVSTAAMGIYAGDITNAKQYALKLFETAILRNLIRIGYDMNQKGYAREDALQLLADGSNGIGKLYQAIAGMKSKTLAEGISELTDELAAIASSPDGMLGIRGSLRRLNNIMKGYRKGNMIVIAASSGEGKTTFALQEISEMARAGRMVGVISLEMTQSELLLKLACERLNYPIDAALAGTLEDYQLRELGKTLDVIGKWPMQISDTPGLKIGEVKANARMWKSRYKMDILFIDHLHLIRGDRDYGTPEQQFTDIANQIKEIAKELEVPVVALAQLARKELTEKRMHVMTDLKYAGGIEQASDVIIMIFRPEHHNIMTTSDGGSTAGQAVIKVEKLRLLRPGSVKCEFDGLRFSEATDNLQGWKPVELPKDEAAPF